MYFSKPDDPQNLKAILEIIETAEQTNIVAYDKALLTLASAALALSLAFTKDLVPFATAQKLWVLIASWGGLVLTLVINVGAFIWTPWMVPARTNITFDALRHGKKTQRDLETFLLKDQRTLRTLNIAQGIVFLLSMMLLTFYVCYDVWHGPDASWAEWAARK